MPILRDWVEAFLAIKSTKQMQAIQEEQIPPTQALRTVGRHPAIRPGPMRAEDITPVAQAAPLAIWGLAAQVAAWGQAARVALRILPAFPARCVRTGKGPNA
jgi:hypothetical protein